MIGEIDRLSGDILACLYQKLKGRQPRLHFEPRPDVSRLMVDAVLDYAQTVVNGNKDPEFRIVPDKLRDGQTIVDFVSITDRRRENGKYDGICW